MGNLVHFEPAPGRVLVKPQDISTTTATQLNESDDSSNIGEVIAVGSDYTNLHGVFIPPPCAPGDLIAFSETTTQGVRAYQPLVLDHVFYQVVLYDGVMGVIIDG